MVNSPVPSNASSNTPSNVYPKKPIPIIFDSDGGIDDAAALWFACTSPEIEVVAVTAVAGNVDLSQAAVNLATILAAAGHGHIPVAVGREDPIGPALSGNRPAGIHGHDGLGDVGIERVVPAFSPETAPELLSRLTRERPGELTIVTVGPMTNLALAVKDDPGLPDRVARLVCMAGSARAGGNASALAEANIAHDPLAAAMVVAAQWPVPPLLVGLDVTLRATLTDAEFALAAAHRSDAALFLDRPLRYYRTLGSNFSAPGTCPCHDLLATMAVADPELVTGPVLPIAVDTGESAGWASTVVDFRYPILSARGGWHGPVPESMWQIGLEVNLEAFRSGARRLFGGGNQ
jgi:purine nucleosidase